MNITDTQKLGYQIMMTISRYFGADTELSNNNLNIALETLCSTTAFFLATKSDEDGLEDYIDNLRDMVTKAPTE